MKYELFQALAELRENPPTGYERGTVNHISFLRGLIEARKLIQRYISFQPIETAHMPETDDPEFGTRVQLVVDCGPDTIQSVRIGWWSQGEWMIDGLFKSFRQMGYRVTHWAPLMEIDV